MPADREEKTDGEPEQEQDDQPFEGLEGEREWFQVVGPYPGPGDSDGGGSD